MFDCESIFLLALASGKTAYAKLWRSDNEPASEGCDACVGYSVYGGDKSLLDGGELDYSTDDPAYDSLAAVAGILKPDLEEALGETITSIQIENGIDPEDLE